jgi:transcriptional regulator with XRE-family HTH domain
MKHAKTHPLRTLNPQQMLKELKRRFKTQKAVMSVTGLSRSTLERIDNGEPVSKLTPLTLAKLWKALNP